MTSISSLKAMCAPKLQSTAMEKIGKNPNKFPLIFLKNSDVLRGVSNEFLAKVFEVHSFQHLKTALFCNDFSNRHQLQPALFNRFNDAVADTRNSNLIHKLNRLMNDYSVKLSPTTQQTTETTQEPAAVNKLFVMLGKRVIDNLDKPTSPVDLKAIPPLSFLRADLVAYAISKGKLSQLLLEIKKAYPKFDFSKLNLSKAASIMAFGAMASHHSHPAAALNSKKKFRTRLKDLAALLSLHPERSVLESNRELLNTWAKSAAVLHDAASLELLLQYSHQHNVQKMVGPVLRKGMKNLNLLDQEAGKRQAATLKVLTDRGASVMKPVSSVGLRARAFTGTHMDCMSFPICDQDAHITKEAHNFIVKRMIAECKADSEKLQEVAENGTTCAWRMEVLEAIAPGKYTAHKKPERDSFDLFTSSSSDDDLFFG